MAKPSKFLPGSRLIYYQHLISLTESCRLLQEKKCISPHRGPKRHGRDSRARTLSNMFPRVYRAITVRIIFMFFMLLNHIKHKVTGGRFWIFSGGMRKGGRLGRY